MVHDLEAPCSSDSIDWSRLYRARGDEVVSHRPYFTGDVFEGVEVQNPDGSSKRKNVIEDVGGVTRQRMLEDEQHRSEIRRQMRSAVRSLA
jgi:hypothetical protein